MLWSWVQGLRRLEEDALVSYALTMVNNMLDRKMA